jgi:ferredoxin
MSGLRVRIDASACIGSSNCAEEAPDAFEVGPEGVAVLVASTAPPEAILAGARACPVDAIQVFEIASDRRIHP